MKRAGAGGTARGARARISVAGRSATRDLVGWREWIGLPDLGIALLPAKVDTGARSCALHAMDVEPFTRNGEGWVRFAVAGEPGSSPAARRIHEAPVRDVREVRSSSGEVQRRYVIATALHVARRRFQVEVTLADRSEMEFPMLIGRSALRTARLVVHPSRSFLQGRPRG